jgi:lysophospholipase L1-like esterase
LKKSILRNITLSLITISLILLILEVFLRIYIKPSYYQKNNQAYTYHTNPRNYYDFLGHDADGLALYGLNYKKEHLYRKPPPSKKSKNNYENSKLKILGIGDSITFGLGVRYQDIYLSKLADKLKVTPIYIKNAGIIGADIAQIEKTLISETTKTHYDLVIYCFSLTDFGLPKNIGAKKSPQKLSALYSFVSHNIRKIQTSRKTRRAYLNSFSKPESAQYFQKINKMAQKQNTNKTEFILVISPILWQLNNNYPFMPIHNQIKDFCQKNSIKCLDLLPYFKKHPANDLWAAPTDHHPNEIAHEIIANALTSYINKHN